MLFRLFILWVIGTLAAYYPVPWVIGVLLFTSFGLIIVLKWDGALLVLILLLGLFRTSRLVTPQCSLEEPAIIQARCLEVRTIGSRDFGVFYVEESTAFELEHCKVLVDLQKRFHIQPPARITCSIQGLLPQNSAHFDEKAWFRREGWALKGTLLRVHRIFHLPPNGLERNWQYAQDRISSLRISRFSKRLARALVLGEGRALGKKDREPFTQTGTAHVLAISGLHVGLFYMLLKQLSFLITSLAFRRLLFLILAGLCLFGLSEWTGHSPSVVRACLMFFFWECSMQLERDRFSLNGLWLAALFSLIYFPRWIFSAGFHLSYLAVAAIILGLKSWTRRRDLSNMQKAGLGIIQVPILAQLGTGPVALYYFKLWPTYFLPANVLLSPVLPLLLFGAWALVLLPAGPILWWYAWTWGKSADGVYWFLKQMAEWPFSSINAEFELHVLLVFGLIAWGLILKARKITVWVLLTAVVLTLRIAYWWN